MFSMLRNTAVLGGLFAFARSRKGRELTAKAKSFIADPQNQRKAKEWGGKFMDKRGQSGPA